MTIFDGAELARIIGSGEGRQVEFKEGLAKDGRVARTICAFANTKGGILLIGVDDRGRIRGIPRPGAVAHGLREIAATAIDPAVGVRVESTRLGRAPIVWCSVPLSPARPHAVRRGSAGNDPEVLVRVGSSNRCASFKAILSLHPAPAGSLFPLELRIVEALAGGRPSTIESFARLHAVGKQKARQAFERLERAGLLVAHGLGDRRLFEPA